MLNDDDDDDAATGNGDSGGDSDGDGAANGKIVKKSKGRKLTDYAAYAR